MTLNISWKKSVIKILVFPQISNNLKFPKRMSHTLTVYPYVIKFQPKLPILHPHVNIYAFDLDHTVIKPKTPGKFPRSSTDWKFMNFAEDKSTIDVILKIIRDDTDAIVVIFTNQGGIVSVPSNSKSCLKFTDKIELIIKDIKSREDGALLLDRLWLYAATKKPASLFPRSGKNLKGKITKIKNNSVSKFPNFTPEIFEKMRKPEIGMFEEFKNDLKKKSVDSELQVMFYCGDAAGRKTDFSDADKLFAQNLKINFKIPEDIFI